MLRPTGPAPLAVREVAGDSRLRSRPAASLAPGGPGGLVRLAVASIAAAGLLGCDGTGGLARTGGGVVAGGGGAAPSPDVPSLQAELDARRAAFAASAPPERAAIHEDGIDEVGGSRVMDTALRAGDRAPDFELPVAGGGTFRLSDALERGPVVLTWYRGGWCPYCTIQLRAYGAALDAFERRGATLVAIGPEVEASALATAEDEGLPYPVLSDRGNVVAADYGIGYRLPGAVIEQFTGRLDLPERNGDASWTLPLSVTYVVGSDRTIAWAFVDADYRRRAETADVLAALDRLEAEGRAHGRTDGAIAGTTLGGPAADGDPRRPGGSPADGGDAAPSPR